MSRFLGLLYCATLLRKTRLLAPRRWMSLCKPLNIPPIDWFNFGGFLSHGWSSSHQGFQYVSILKWSYCGYGGTSILGNLHIGDDGPNRCVAEDYNPWDPCVGIWEHFSQPHGASFIWQYFKVGCKFRTPKSHMLSSFPKFQVQFWGIPDFKSEINSVVSILNTLLRSSWANLTIAASIRCLTLWALVITIAEQISIGNYHSSTSNCEHYCFPIVEKMTDFTSSFCQSFLVSEVCNLTSQQIFSRVSLSLVTVPTHEIDQVLTLPI